MSRGELLFYGGSVLCALSLVGIMLIKRRFKRILNRLLDEIEREL